MSRDEKGRPPIRRAPSLQYPNNQIVNPAGDISAFPLIQNCESFGDSRLELSYGSDGRKLSEAEYFAVRLGALTNYSEEEPRNVTLARSRIDSAQRTLEHLQSEHLPPPIFQSFEYIGLKLRGIK